MKQLDVYTCINSRLMPPLPPPPTPSPLKIMRSKKGHSFGKIMLKWGAHTETTRIKARS